MGEKTVRFGTYGVGAVRLWLYRAGGTSCYNWANGQFDGRNRQSTTHVANADDMFVYGAVGYGFPDGDYELHVAPATLKGEPPKCRRVYFRLFTVDGEQFCEKTGESLPPPDPPAPPAAATIADAFRATDGGTMAVSMYAAAPPAPPAPQPSGPTLEFEGRTRTVADWARERGLSPLTIYARLARGCTVEEALATPSPKPDNGPGDVRAGRAVELD